MIRVEIDGSFLPTDFVRVADSPAEGVEHGHDDATGEHHNPADQEEVRYHNEDHAGWKSKH
jgi:hypothetical protein